MCSKVSKSNVELRVSTSFRASFRIHSFEPFHLESKSVFLFQYEALTDKWRKGISLFHSNQTYLVTAAINFLVHS